MDAPTVSMNEANEADYNLRILGPVASYFADRPGGAEIFAGICERAHVSPADFERKICWVSWATMEAFLRETRDELGSDEELWRACCHRMDKSYGAMRLLAWSFSPRFVYATAPRIGKYLTSAGRFELIESTPRSARMRYTSKFKESRLLCISRQAQSAAAPGMWGLPRATVREHSCIAHGDAACEYEFVWMTPRVWTWPVLIGALSSLVAWRFASFVGGSPLYALPAFAVLLAYSIERHRVAALNQLTMAEVTDALRAAVSAEAEVRRELFALQERNAHWARLVEQAQRDRQAAIEAAQEKLSLLSSDQQIAALGVSHDLNNPMTVILSGIDILMDDALTREQRETALEMKEQGLKVKRLVSELMTILKDKTRVPLKPIRIETRPLVEEVRKRAASLVFEKDIKVTVFANRECPESILVDRSAIDRILDNVLSNASKYTARGSIVVELDGVPDFLVLKISDTGRGIEASEMDRVFRPGQSDESSRAPSSYGVGLAGTVDLLGELGGRLEVMSKVGQGTTFWIHVPIEPPRETKPIDLAEKRLEKSLLHVVHVRKHPG
jgi:signal transduction histidine kinase